MLRPTKLSDLSFIDELWTKHHADSFGLPNENKAVGSQICEVDGKLAAYGQLKLLAEALIVLDMDLSTRKRVECIIEMLTYCINGAKKSGLEQIHVFIKDENYAKILQERFSFLRVRDIPLVLNLK